MKSLTFFSNPLLGERAAGLPPRLEPNCFITPHTAGGHRAGDKTLVRHFLEILRRYLSREPLIDRII